MAGRQLTAAVLIVLGMLQHAAAAERPNVVFVLTDDQGYGDLSCHGNPILKTPYLDRLARQSIRFTDFHVAPMCTATRARLKVSDVDVSKAIGKRDKAVEFVVDLEPGNTHLQTWFLDAEGDELCGAFYVEVFRLP